MLFGLTFALDLIVVCYCGVVVITFAVCLSLILWVWLAVAWCAGLVNRLSFFLALAVRRLVLCFV